MDTRGARRTDSMNCLNSIVTYLVCPCSSYSVQFLHVGYPMHFIRFVPKQIILRGAAYPHTVGIGYQ